jgi:hypothetical protein
MGGGARNPAVYAYVRALRIRARVRTARGSGPTLWIVAGPSSSGKSTFLRSDRAPAITGLPADTPVIRAGRVRDRMPLLLRTDAYVHYNISRPLFSGGETDPARLVGLDWRRTDRAWRDVASLPVAKRAIVLVADRETLLERVRERRTREPSSTLGYSRRKFRRHLRAVDPAAIYDQWREELTQCGIPYVELDACTYELRRCG